MPVRAGRSPEGWIREHRPSLVVIDSIAAVFDGDLKALVDLLLYLEKNFSVLPPESPAALATASRWRSISSNRAHVASRGREVREARAIMKRRGSAIGSG